MKNKVIIKKLTGLLLSISMLALAAPGFAENREGAFTVSPFVGGYNFDHGKSDKGEKYQNLEASPIFGVRAGYNFTENWGAEAQFGYSLAESRAANYPEADVYSYGIEGLYHFNLTKDFVPFLAAGIGGMHHKYPAPGLGFYPEYTANYGVGLKYFVADNVALRGDVRHVILPDDGFNNLEYTAGVTFQFGGVQPATKPLAECPPGVAAADTTAPYVTLATPANNSDGAPLQRNPSVAFSEEMDTATINARTVTLSQGNTVVPGKVIVASSTNAFFAQTSDLAPDTQYTGRVTTGVKDRAGNPLANDFLWSFRTASAPLSKTVTKTVVVYQFAMLEDSHFEFDKAVLSKSGREKMKLNAKIMKDNPDLKVRVAGYASAAGSEDYNQDLSERRAGAVKAYLVSEGGIASERIETIGYGKTRPAQVEENPEDHNSAAAKANMRVVFEVIEK